MLTDSLIRSVKHSTRPRKLSDRGGLHLLVAPNGGRYWRYSYRYNGKQKTVAVCGELGVTRPRVTDTSCGSETATDTR
jgi:hypothetical protein